MAQNWVWRWAGAVASVALAVWLCALYVDRPVALYAARFHLYDGILASSPLQAPVLVALALLAVMVGSLPRMLGWSLSPAAQALDDAAILSGLAMAWGLCLTEFLLKPVFGRSVPFDLLQHGDYAFHWFARSDASGSFPSGHAVQIASVASVFWAAFPRCRVLCALAVAAVALALILAERHFVSDIVAGTLIGVVAGNLIQAVWRSRGAA